jgi:hypothetical protein
MLPPLGDGGSDGGRFCAVPSTPAIWLLFDEKDTTIAYLHALAPIVLMEESRQ